MTKSATFKNYHDDDELLFVDVVLGDGVFVDHDLAGVDQLLGVDLLASVKELMEPHRALTEVMAVMALAVIRLVSTQWLIQWSREQKSIANTKHFSFL